MGGYVCVDLPVIGIGFAGLPLACEAAFSGLKMIGLDANADRVARLNSSRSHVVGISQADIAGMLTRGFRATATEADAGIRKPS